MWETSATSESDEILYLTYGRQIQQRVKEMSSLSSKHY